VTEGELERMPIDTIQQDSLLRIGLQRNLEAPQRDESAQPPDFQSMLVEFVGDVNEAQHTAGEAVNRLVAGEPTEIHEVMIAVEKAGVSFELMLEIRNKMLEAYQEVMRTQI
jgi:flagellar hook-basal body complex protein FliE